MKTYRLTIPLLAAAATALQAISIQSAQAGTAPPAAESGSQRHGIPEPPSSLAGGLLTIDAQERFRVEARENTFDFNDAANPGGRI